MERGPRRSPCISPPAARFSNNNTLNTMPRAWQITEARALQTQGVWNLAETFMVGACSRDDHADLRLTLTTAAVATEVAQNILDTRDGALRAEYDHFKSLNAAIGSRLDSEVDDGDALQRDIDQIRKISPASRAEIDDRTLKTIEAWKKVNTARAALAPPLPAVTVRGTAVAAYETRWQALPALRQEREVAAAAWREKNSVMEGARRSLDRVNKDWYQAWRAEYPDGTPEGDALAGVDTESGTALPQVLEIAAVVQQGLSLQVSYVPGTGQHATVKDLNWLVEGVHADWQRVAADPAAGNEIGPFTAGQIVRVRTDVGNSRDHSETSAEQAVTIS